MAINTKTIRRRIKSIGNTKKITKAMEMISAVKMRKAVAQDLASRSYSDYAWEVLLDISAKTKRRAHPLLERRAVKKVLLALVASNRGLAGGFSSKLLQEADRYIKEQEKKGIKVEVVALGKKSKKIHTNFGHTIVADFEKTDITTSVEEVMPLVRFLLNAYTEKTHDRVVIAYTHYASAVRQTPRVRQVLPIEQNSLDGRTIEQDKKTQKLIDFKFEPTLERVLEMLLPRLLAAQVFQVILESDASEHSARMMAMRNATDAAKDMIKELTSSFNKARQAAITQEISEIVGGAAAL